ncbi:unnamed protein product, partial [Mesorhabditis belari]|uniref:E3 ubiquitin-protein ligase n=1 Tax=Mesorhabditis belari TaxID=2138241 RepID=A0AAF3EHN9_9BILA
MINFINHTGFYAFSAEINGGICGLATLYFALIGVTGLALILPTYHSLHQQRRLMSKKTLRFQRLWLRNLTIQVLIFIGVVFVPFCWETAVGWGWPESAPLSVYTIWTTAIGCSHWTLSTVVLLFVYDSYRKRLFESVKMVIGIRKKDQRISVTATSVMRVSLTFSRRFSTDWSQKKEAQNFIYRLELSTHRHLLVWEPTPRSIHEGVAHAISQSDCLAFDTPAAQLFAENGNLGINVTHIQLNESLR